MVIDIDFDNVEIPPLNENEDVEEPKKGMSFSSKEEVYKFYARYARRIGFFIANRTQSVRDYGKLKYFLIECSRARKRKNKSKVNPLKLALSTKIDCKSRIRATLQVDGNFMLTTIVLEHNHDLLPHDSRHFSCNKKIATPVKRILESNDEAGIGAARNFRGLVVEAGGYDKVTYDERDCRNHIEKARRLRLGIGDVESICNYFVRMQSVNSNFFYVMDFDDEFHIRNLFWVDARSSETYKEFGDVISFDTTYLTNKYGMPFAPFVGVNHHGQSTLLGCGLLSNEDTNTFVWLFKSWLSCMSDCPPTAIITDQCKAMQNAIQMVFLEARHRWCLWHVMKKIPKKLSRYTYCELIKFKMMNVVYDSFTQNEFEFGWKVMIVKFILNENEWLRALYQERQRWVPIYVTDVFWAGMSTTGRSESMNAFFDGYVNSKTTLKQFVE